jgi:hypothetical protein
MITMDTISEDHALMYQEFVLIGLKQPQTYKGQVLSKPLA